MSNANLHILADRFIFEDLLISNAQDNSFIGSITSYVKLLYDPERPYSSILSFIGPGLLFKAGFPWVAVIYELMDALGFDWKGLWHSLGQGIINLVKSKSASDENIDRLVDEKVNDNFNGEMDADKVKDILSKGLKTESNIVINLSSFGSDIQDNFIKRASVKSKLTSWLVKKLGWLLKAVLISLGLAGGAAIVSGISGGAKPLAMNNTENKDNTTPDQPKIPLSTKAPRELFTYNRNDLSSVWIETGDIHSISNEIMTWILAAYPQLSDKKEEIQSSTGFQDILKKFNDRNRLAAGTGLIAVPRPFTKRIDIVNTIINTLEDANT